MKSEEYKILWISDIHFSVKYEDAFQKNPALEIYFSQFNSKINDLIVTGGGRMFDYIFLTGDLAQAGTTEDYICLFDKFLKPLLDLLLVLSDKRPKVVVIPGNHDVDWQKSEFLKEYVRKIEPGKKEPVERAAYLEEHLEEFKKLFTDYRKFLLEYVIDVEGGKYCEFFSMDNATEFMVSPEYQQHRLFGYLIDHKRRLIINLVNTAWYSLGGRFNNILAELESHPDQWNLYNVTGGDKAEFPTVGSLLRKHTTHRLKEVLNKKEYISEYNSQITGINIFELEQMQNDRNKYGEYFVVTCMHHPFNWLKWDEHYAFDMHDENANANRLSKLILSSNLILTGHEHVPKQVDGEVKSNGCVMLKSGCFLFDNQHTDKGSLKNGWFSVLHIDPDRAIVRQDKHYYTVKSPNGMWDDMMSDRTRQNNTGYYKLHKETSGYKSAGSRLQEISDMVKESSERQFQTFLDSILAPASKSRSVLLIKKDDSKFIFDVQREGEEELRELCILLRTENAYSAITQKEFSEELIAVAKGISGKIDIFRFVVLDLFAESPDVSRLPSYQQQYFERAGRVLQLQLKTAIADDMFDVMRYKLFIDFEKRFEDSGIMPAEFELIRDAMFINTVIPFWVAEKIWRTASKQYD